MAHKDYLCHIQKTIVRTSFIMSTLARRSGGFIVQTFNMPFHKEHLAIRRIFSLVDIITNTKFSNCPNVFEIGVV